MNETELVKILAELGHKTRLSVYKFIMKYGNREVYCFVNIGNLNKAINFLTTECCAETNQSGYPPLNIYYEEKER